MGSIILCIVFLYFAFHFIQRHRFFFGLVFSLFLLFVLCHVRLPDALVPLMVLGYVGLTALWIKRRFGHHDKDRDHDGDRRRERVRLPVSSLDDDR
jgi:hypothetical protein